MEVGVVGGKAGIGGKKKRSGGVKAGGDRGTGGPGPNGGGGGGGGESYDFVPYEKSFSKSKILTGFLLVVVLMTFGAIIGAYIVISTNGVLEWRPFSLPVPVFVSTALLVASSVAYVLAQRAVLANDTNGTRRYLIATTVFGGMFIASQLIAWIEMAGRGYFMRSNPYAAFFYFMTAVHALHVIGGVIALGYITLRAWHPTLDEPEIEKRGDLAVSVGWYWHFMGGLWIVILLLLGFWK